MSRLIASLIAASAAVLVLGGLAWVTRAALDLEESERARLALWRLDGRVTPALAREDSRPFEQYEAVYPPVPLLRPPATPVPAGWAFAPSPLLDAELPPWMLLHFQVVAGQAVRSPQVPPAALEAALRSPEARVGLTNVRPERKALLAKLNGSAAFRALASASELPEPSFNDNLSNPTPAQQQAGFNNDYDQRTRVQNITKMERGALTNSGNINVIPPGAATTYWCDQVEKRGGFIALDPRQVSVEPLQPLWLTLDDGSPMLLMARSVKAGERRALQGVVLDWRALEKALRKEVDELFPEATLRPILPGDTGSADRAMSALPVRLDPGPGGVLGWTPLRVGLALAWLATALALGVAGLGGAALVDLSERRIRFVSAVTHELRTPLTTLRLYIDLLASGVVHEPQQQREYLRTLDAESDRLNRLIGNVLDFARLERHRPRAVRASVDIPALMSDIERAWAGRFQSCGLTFTIDASMAPPRLLTDAALVEQTLAVLLDNAAKYGRGADGVTLRCHCDGNGTAFDVIDAGPGVPMAERRAIFRPFRRGAETPAHAGGVGLGLALARRWAAVLGGRIECTAADGGGALFRLRISGPVISRGK